MKELELIEHKAPFILRHFEYPLNQFQYKVERLPSKDDNLSEQTDDNCKNC